MKRLERWKEQKALEKEKEKREKEHKGVFKIGLYQPKDSITFSMLPSVQPASSRLKEVMVHYVMQAYLCCTTHFCIAFVYNEMKD